MSNSKKIFATLGMSVLALGAISLGSGQTAANTDTTAETQIQANRDGQSANRNGQRNNRGSGNLGLLNAADGTTVTATFYNADPAQGGAVVNSYSLVVGQDSERTFMTNVREAMETAGFAIMTTGPQSRIVEIPQADGEEEGNRRGNRGLRGLNIRGLDAGSTVQVSFYNGDPAQGGAVISSLSFTQGQSSESAFMESVQTALETASFAQINTGQQTNSMDLAARRAAQEERAAARAEAGENRQTGEGRGTRGQRGQRGEGGQGGQGGQNGQTAPQGQTN